MERPNVIGDRSGSILRVALLIAAVCTYFVDKDDVVWRFIKTSPHARLLEHVCFGAAALMLGIALLLKIQASVSVHEQGIHDPSRIRVAAASVLRAIGIGSLLPLPGFLLLVLGDLGVSLLLYGPRAVSERTTARSNFRPADRPSPAHPWRDALVRHIGLCCAFVSMLVFSIVLIDRVADGLFAATALISVAASARSALHARAGEA